MKRLERQQWVIFGIAMTIVTGFGLFQYYPHVRTAHTIRKAIEQQKVISDETDLLIQQMSQLRGQVDSLKPVKAEFEEKLPRTRQVAALWQQITDVMNQHRLTSQVVQRESESEDDRFGTVRIHLECGGTFQQMYAFFQSLHALDRFIRIEKFKLTNENNYSGQVKLDATAQVYYQIASTDSQ
ncbi:MAG: type 4a pilus biogenesis protein PilO [Phycisphaerae bacterium]|nr:type 4a pilus biogenesis protein PilO [Phycisphaerae bacterium]